MKSIKFLAAASAMALSVASHAAPALYSMPGSSGQIATPGSYGFIAAAGAGAGSLSFNLDGYLSLDGDSNCCTDVFTLSVNSTDVLQLSYNLGGGGGNVVYFQPAGSSITGGIGGGAVPFTGGQAQISLPVALLNGNNTFQFSYTGGAQGIGDEAWGISNVLLTGPAFVSNGAVPEPATWAMMIAGFGLVSMAMRRKQNVTVRYA